MDEGTGESHDALERFLIEIYQPILTFHRVERCYCYDVVFRDTLGFSFGFRM